MICLLTIFKQNKVWKKFSTSEKMLKRQLVALDYPNPDNINVNDVKEYRNIISFLEDQKIRHYKIEDRADLRKVSSERWNQAFEKYKSDLNCPTELKSPAEQLKWILSYAIKLEYMDNAEKYRPLTSDKLIEEKQKGNAPSIKSTNPFDNLDFHSKDFETGVRELATRLQIPYHPDHLLTLTAISRVIKDNLNKEAIKQAIPEGKPFPIFEGQGMGQNDDDMEKAARILRLLQIHSIRDIQTLINETIVTTQDITADPKTDTKLGKVGF